MELYWLHMHLATASFRLALKGLISVISILIHHPAISIPYNSDFGHAAPPSMQKGLTSENPPMALYP